jgi:lysozyme
VIQRKHVAWLSICVGCVAGAEGLRTVAYTDPVGIPTVCFGETAGVELGQTYTVEQCREKLGARVLEFGAAVDRCVHTPMSAHRKAGLTSFAYNVGTDAFCGSTLVRRLNAGDPGRLRRDAALDEGQGRAAARAGEAPGAGAGALPRVNWQRILAYGLVLILFAGILELDGYRRGERKLWEYQAKQAKAAVPVIVKQGATTERVVTQYRDRVVKIKGDTEYIEKEVTPLCPAFR